MLKLLRLDEKKFLNTLKKNLTCNLVQKLLETNKLQLYDFEKGEVCLFLMSECER